jgi:hypothetical protein
MFIGFQKELHAVRVIPRNNRQPAMFTHGGFQALSESPIHHDRIATLFPGRPPTR